MLFGDMDVSNPPRHASKIYKVFPSKFGFLPQMDETFATLAIWLLRILPKGNVLRLHPLQVSARSAG